MVDYDRIRKQLVRSINRVCPRWLADQRDDIVQNAMLRLLEIEKRGELNPSPPASYLWKVAYTATIDQIRRARRRPEEPLEPAMLEAGPDPAGDPTLQERARWDLGRTVRRCLNEMHERRRLIVGLHLLGHELSECASLSGWRFNQVRNLLYRGLADLRRCLASKGVRA
jgi:RNA polymerase sigma-70 factor (ECF subfamily)